MPTIASFVPGEILRWESFPKSYAIENTEQRVLADVFRQRNFRAQHAPSRAREFVERVVVQLSYDVPRPVEELTLLGVWEESMARAVLHTTWVSAREIRL